MHGTSLAMGRRRFRAPVEERNGSRSANLGNGESTGVGTNTVLGTTGLDVPQVFMSFGRKDFGAFTRGRNVGLFGFDSIINDMTVPGVGAGAGGNMGLASPSNTSLGSIGVGYIGCDTLAQMNDTAPDFNGGAFLSF